MTIGTVTWFSPIRGIGFIRADDGIDLFVRAVHIEMAGFRSLRAGDRVMFTVQASVDGPEAINVAHAADPDIDISDDQAVAGLLARARAGDPAPR